MSKVEKWCRGKLRDKFPGARAFWSRNPANGQLVIVLDIPRVGNLIKPDGEPMSYWTYRDTWDEIASAIGVLADMADSLKPVELSALSMSEN